jgi:V8-like Glu-specific endopeptidase
MSQDDRDLEVVSSPPNTQTHEELLAFWTPERRRSATPRTDANVAAPTEAGAGPEQLITQRVHDPNEYPYRTVGKLYFRFPSEPGRYSVGSAVVINRRGIITCAHNLYDPTLREWATDFLFCPAYDHGTSPTYLAWAFDTSHVMAAWIDSGNYAYDVGMAIAKPNDGSEIGDRVGLLTYSVELPPQNRSWNTVGYPQLAGTPYDGEVMWECEGSFTGWRTQNQIIIKENALPAGTSGGPWLRADDQSSVNGIYSQYNQGYTANTSSYFAAWVTVLYQKTFAATEPAALRAGAGS